MILEAFSRLQIQPNMIGDCSDITLLMELISSDFCASILPETVLNISNLAEMSSPVGLIWLKNLCLSKVAQNFVGMIQRYGAMPCQFPQRLFCTNRTVPIIFL